MCFGGCSIWDGTWSDSVIWTGASPHQTDFSGRGTRKPERIGKKYQWIAYHEILAHISDHYQYRVSYNDLVPEDAYRGTWQLDVRDIDPSAVVVATARRRERPEGFHQVVEPRRASRARR